MQASAWPACEYFLSFPQFVQLDAPAAENVPLAHSGVALEPSHFEPAGHVEQVSRVAAEAPVVKLPSAQLRQASAWPACEYFLSFPQAVQTQAPAAENVPLAQVTTGLLPLHFEPAGQVVHVSRVLDVAPVV